MSSKSSHRGILVIISSPSGAGKTTLARRLLAEFGNVKFSVSYTTRPIRRGETDGVDYFFVDDKTFDSMAQAGEFAEWAHVHGNRYGTSRTVVENALSGGSDVVFDVDWQGGEALATQWPDDALMVFILPPNWETLETRLRRRATDSAEVIDRRMDMALIEIEHHQAYHHMLVNDDLDEAYKLLRIMYLARRSPEACSASERKQIRENEVIDKEHIVKTLLADGKKSRNKSHH